jgi:uncharacterized caspase-like protein
MNLRLVVHVLMTVGAAAILAGSTSPAVAEGYALVVGVNDCPEFRLADGSRPRALRGAQSDAQAIAAVLTEKFHFAKERVFSLQGQDATREAFVKRFEQLLESLGHEDSFVLYFAGHGTQVADQRPLDEADGLDEALCLADTTGEGKNLVRDDELGKWLEDCRAGRITVIFDCCHSGTGIKDPTEDIAARYLPMAGSRMGTPVDGEPQFPWQDLRSSTKSLERRSLAALFACQPQQQAYERRFAGQQAPARSGQFTHYLIAALKDPSADTDRDNRLTTAETVAYITKHLDATFNDLRPAATDRQQPSAEDTGDEFFLTIATPNTPGPE